MAFIIILTIFEHKKLMNRLSLLTIMHLPFQLKEHILCIIAYNYRSNDVKTKLLIFSGCRDGSSG
jgi:hypothetical protein